MKKALKIAGIAVGSILAFFIVVIMVLCFVVFSPSRLTPIVQKHADLFVKCEYHIEEADLTFFSTFPDFAIHVRNVTLVNPFPGAQSDTLLNVKDLSASIQIMEFIRYGAIVVNHVGLEDGYVNVYRENDSINNYSVFDLGEEEEEDTTSSIVYLGLNLVELENVNATYVDKGLNVDARLRGLEAKVHGRFFAEEESFDVEAMLKAKEIGFGWKGETEHAPSVQAKVEDFKLTAEGMMEVKHFDGEVGLKLPKLWFALNGETMVDNRDIEVRLPADVNIEYMYANLHEGTQIAVDENEIGVKGKVQMCDNGDIYASVEFETNEWDIEKTIGLIPDAYRGLVSEYELKGGLKLKGKVNGTLAEENYPLVFCDVMLKDCSAKVKQVPYDLREINADVYADLNLNEGYASDVTIRSLSAKADDITVDASGRVSDVLGKMLCDVKVKSHLPLKTAQKIVPKDLKVRMTGVTDVDLAAKFALADVTGLRLDKIKVNGTIDYSGLDVLYNDSIHIIDNKGRVDVHLPSPHRNAHFKELGQVLVKGEKMKVDIDMGRDGACSVCTTKPDLKVGFGDILNDKQFIQANCQMKFNELKGTMDTISFDVVKPDIEATVFPMKGKPKQPGITAKLESKHLSARMGGQLVANTADLELSGFTTFDETQENVLLKLNPSLNVNLTDGYLKMAGLGYPVSIPQIKFKFTPKELDIDNSRIVLGNSDFNLSGKITNIRGYVEKNELLKGDLSFLSDKTDIDQLMDIVNGFGNEEETEGETEHAPSVQESEGDPFMVPKGVDIALNTHISHAYFNEKEIRDVKGKLTVKDGILLAEQMGFTTDAAEMQLTAIYRSQRRNHLFCGVDFHLLKIDIHELIDMIPAIDTIVPMLKAFEGKAEFHFAGETYLNAKYEPKMSTLVGAAALEGKDLVVMDNETFSTISKYLMFNKKTKNVIDSLSVEATIFQNEIDVYPFLVTMDKWQAVLAGRHNLDMSFNYHISLTDCPLPVRLGLDINGTFDNPKFKLAPCQYKALFKPAKQGATDKQTLKLKKQISDALKANVKKTE